MSDPVRATKGSIPVCATNLIFRGIVERRLDPAAVQASVTELQAMAASETSAAIGKGELSEEESMVALTGYPRGCRFADGLRLHLSPLCGVHRRGTSS